MQVEATRYPLELKAQQAAELLRVRANAVIRLRQCG